ncbi:ribonuclease H-like domain-containing protein [Litchfieldia alkalitelluris]|uniref:ribonuclease H-like domain-containing protein n=1 Tax=Litchfieldia alkalitelluris TaxID=304268 RepID=UPI00099657CC|nr:ribonuclease H-like domain-containing protein [Litchfieldia alkalitelluris]
MSLKNKLNRHKKNIVRTDQFAPVSSPVSDIVTEEVPHLDKWNELGAVPFLFDNTYCMVRKVRYPLNYKHGIYQFNELNQIVSDWNLSTINHPLSSKGFQANQLFFFDTETTGLGGGAGNTIFLLGQATLTNEYVEVIQHFLPNPGAEVALYQSFLKSIDYKTLVTYNGKSFDWPQVKTRHTLIRETVPNLPEFGHFDLYHASRRLWKNKLQSVRLANVEKDILSIHREGDVPGYLAPMLYFNFLENQNPEAIKGVLHHNEIDVLSLITLYIHLSKQLLNNGLNNSESEKYEVARWLNHLGEEKVAATMYESISGSQTNTSLKAKLQLAYMYKKQKDYETSLSFFLDVFNEGERVTKLEIAIELAKIYEHQQKNFEKAIHFTLEAKNIYKTQTSLIRDQNGYKNDEIEKRLNRLKKKAGNKR